MYDQGIKGAEASLPLEPFYLLPPPTVERGYVFGAVRMSACHQDHATSRLMAMNIGEKVYHGMRKKPLSPGKTNINADQMRENNETKTKH